MAELKVLGRKLSPFSFRVEWALKLKGIEYEFMEEDLCNKSPLLLSSNPVHKMILVLIHDGKSISESIIILEYIDEIWKENPILPKFLTREPRMRFFAKFADDKFGQFLAEIATTFSSIGEGQAKAIELAQEALKVLEEEIKGKFFGGEGIGLLDIVIGWIAYWLEIVEEAGCFKVFDKKKFPLLDSWMKNFLEVLIINQNLPPRDDLHIFSRASTT